MRKALAGCLTIMLLGFCVVVLAQAPEATQGNVRLRIVDAETGKSISGIVRIFPRDEKPLSLPGLLRRSMGVNTSIAVAGWHVVPADGARLALPRTKLRLEALSGLE